MPLLPGDPLIDQMMQLANYARFHDMHEAAEAIEETFLKPKPKKVAAVPGEIQVGSRKLRRKSS